MCHDIPPEKNRFFFIIFVNARIFQRIDISKIVRNALFPRRTTLTRFYDLAAHSSERKYKVSMITCFIQFVKVTVG